MLLMKTSNRLMKSRYIFFLLEVSTFELILSVQENNNVCNNHHHHFPFGLISSSWLLCSQHFIHCIQVFSCNLLSYSSNFEFCTRSFILIHVFICTPILYKYDTRPSLLCGAMWTWPKVQKLLYLPQHFPF